MRDAEFWELIGALGPEPDVDRVVARLARRRPEEILGFHERLRLAVAALDTDDHRRQPVADSSGGPPAVPSDDAFEDVRVAVVAHGRDRWRAVVADPGALAGVWPLELGEHLGQAAAEAYERATGDPAPGLDLATPYDPADGGLPPASLHSWLLVIPCEYDEVPLPEAYEQNLEWLKVTLTGADWWGRWEAARGPGSQVNCYLDLTGAARRRSAVRIGKDYAGREEVTVTFRLPRPEEERPDLDPAADDPGWAALARTHTELLLDLLRARFGVELPPLPDPAGLERARRAAADRDRAESIAFAAWNAERTTAVPGIWAGRVPEDALDDLVRTLSHGGRIRLPAMIAAMRARYGIAVADSDAELLARHGYSPAEIATALA